MISSLTPLSIPCDTYLNIRMSGPVILNQLCSSLMVSCEQRNHAGPTWSHIARRSPCKNNDGVRTYPTTRLRLPRN